MGGASRDSTGLGALEEGLNCFKAGNVGVVCYTIRDNWNICSKRDSYLTDKISRLGCQDQ